MPVKKSRLQIAAGDSGADQGSVCSATLVSGKNRGQACGRRVAEREKYCRYHRNASESASKSASASDLLESKSAASLQSTCFSLLVGCAKEEKAAAEDTEKGQEENKAAEKEEKDGKEEGEKGEEKERREERESGFDPAKFVADLTALAAILAPLHNWLEKTRAAPLASVSAAPNVERSN